MADVRAPEISQETGNPVPGRWGPPCNTPRGCGRPEGLHCPGCGACWPDDACGSFCTADPEEIARVCQLIDDWTEEHGHV